MRALHLCFWLHHPYELLGAGKWEKGYFGGENEFKKLDKRDYQPLFALLERNSQRYPKMSVSLVISGVWLEQAERWDRDLVRRLQDLVANGNVEPVAVPYDYSMTAFYDLEELETQVRHTQEKFEQLFGHKSLTVALPELCYQNRLARWMEKRGFQVMLAGDASRSLDWRTSNRVYDVKGCQHLRVLFANSKLSKIISAAQSRATVEVAEELKIDQPDPDLTAPKVVTAAEFVQAFNQSGARSVTKETVSKQKVTYRKEFSAKKYQKQLDLAFLRGDIVTLHLDPEIFGRWRELGIVGFFDELFKIWSETPGNSLVSAQEASRLNPAAEISIKHTVSRAGETEKDYQLPEWWTVAQDEATLALMRLRKKVIASEDTDLYLDFARLTAMDYASGSEQYDEIIKDIESKVARFVVQTEDGEEKVIPSSLAESTAVKVKIKRKPKPVEEAGTQGNATENVDSSENVAEEDADDSAEPDYDEAINMDDMAGGNADTHFTWDADDIDDMEAAIQVMAQRMKRQSANQERDVEGLAEAEVVSEDVRVDFEEADFVFEDELADVDLSEEELVEDEPKVESEPKATKKSKKADKLKKKSKKISIGVD